MPEGIHAAPQIDPRVNLVLERLVPDELAVIDDERLTLRGLRQRLRWSNDLNMAVLPERKVDKDGERQVRLFVAHSTLDNDIVMTPELDFDQRPTEYQTRSKNVYGTGFYTANRPEAAMRVDEKKEGRGLGAFLSMPIKRREVFDNRRSSIASEVAHLVGMVGSEVILPKLQGQQNVARRYAEKANDIWDAHKAKVILLSEAPRRRAEKLKFEKSWHYDLVPPQYALLRLPILRIGSFVRPGEASSGRHGGLEPENQEPQKHSAIAMYGKLFWQVAARNAADMQRLGAPYEFTSRG